MSKIFLTLVNMSISASWIVLAVLVLRLILKKAPKWITVLLWAVVAIRLLCPLTIESALSLLPSSETIPENIELDTTPVIQSGVPVIDRVVNPLITDSNTAVSGASINPLQVTVGILGHLWVLGTVTMLVYAVFSYWRLRRKVSTAVRYTENIFCSDKISSPFVLGVIRPRIYLPFATDEGGRLHIIAHEQAHIRRKDHWWKPLGFVLLSVYWFNPILWLAYILLCRDIEMACDEKVVKEFDLQERADYSQALLNCSVSRRTVVFCPLAFGEVSVKDRVKAILNYRKPAFWILLAGLVATVVLACCFLTNPKTANLASLAYPTVDDGVENTLRVWVSDGETYESAGGVSKDTLRRLLELKISKKAISLDRSEDRDCTHTLVLQREENTQDVMQSYLTGMYIHFNSDFTAVWVDDGVKPTLSYRVTDPKQAGEIYNRISAQIQLPPGDLENTFVAGDAEYMKSVEPLKEKYPMYFDLDTTYGLDIYIWQMAENSYSCIMLPGKTEAYSQTEILAHHQEATTMEDMRNIALYYVLSQGVAQEDVHIHPSAVVHSSYAYVIDEAYAQELEALFREPYIVSPVPEDYAVSVIDEAYWDVDGDGREEYVSINSGPTSGLFTFSIAVYEKGEQEYFNLFNGAFGSIEFMKNKQGQIMLVAGTAKGYKEMSVGVEDGKILVDGNGEEISYWGEQGLASHYASMVKIPPAADPVEKIESEFRTYYKMSDGTWMFRGYTYKYRLVITGRMPNAVKDTTYVYLSNLEDISFDRAMWASGLSSNLSMYFTAEEAVLVEIS